jgi:PAS domain S-box-containing protein
LTFAKGSLNVFHVDDDESLLQISKIFMETLEPDIELRQFTNGNEALSHLDENVDCIITDYKMPTMDGLEFAKRIREISEVPIIIFTGQGSEDVASKAFSIGVNSYIQKSIDPSIWEIVLKEVKNHSERYSGQLLLAESEKKYRTFLENSLDGVTFVVGTEIRFCNRKAAEMLGYTREELTGMHITQITTPEFAARTEEYTLMRQRGEDAPEQYESMALRKDGSQVWFEFHSGMIEFNGEHGSLTVLREVSERVKYRKRLEHLSHYSASLNSVNSLDELYHFTYEILSSALDFDYQDVILVKETYLESVIRDETASSIFRTPIDGLGITVRTVNTRKTQLVNDIRLDPDYFLADELTRKTLSELCVPVMVNGEVFLVLNMESVMVNAFSENDRTLAEIFSHSMGIAIERIRNMGIIFDQNMCIESEQHRTNFMIDNAPYIAVTLDLYGRVKYVNNMFESVFGYSKFDILGKKYDALPTIRAQDAVKVLKILLGLRGGKVPEPFNMTMISKDNQSFSMKSYVWLYSSLLGEREIIVMAKELEDEQTLINNYVSHSRVVDSHIAQSTNTDARVF